MRFKQLSRLVKNAASELLKKRVAMNETSSLQTSMRAGLCCFVSLLGLLLAPSGANAQPTIVDVTANYTTRTITNTLGGGCMVQDKNADLYFAYWDNTNGYAIQELVAVNGVLPTNPQVRTFTNAALVDPVCLALDASGDLFVIDGGLQQVDELVAVDGQLPDNPTLRILYTFPTSSGVIGQTTMVDNNGNLFFSLYYYSSSTPTVMLLKMVAVDGTIPDAPTILTVERYSWDPSTTLEADYYYGMAVDSANNLYLNFESSFIYEYAAQGGAVQANTNHQQLASFTSYTNFEIAGMQIARDQLGDIFFETVDSSTTPFQLEIMELVAVNGAIPSNPQFNLIYRTPSATFYPGGLTVDSQGNVFVTSGSKQTIEISPNASLSISPSSITFPQTNVGSGATAQTATINNASSSAVYLSTGTLTDSTDFSASNNCGGLVEANSSCTVTFNFAPQSTGALASTYSIYNLDTPNLPLTVSLSGTGTQVGSLSIAPVSQTFAATTVGTVSSALTSTITNSTSSIIYLNAGTLTDATDFTQSDNCNGEVQNGGATCTVTFTFKPTSARSLTSTYTISGTNYTNNPYGPLTVTLTGTGTLAPDFSISATPASQSVNPGASARYTVNLASLNGAFGNAVSLSVTGLPTGATATFAPSSVVPGSESSSASTLTIQTVNSLSDLSAKKQSHTRWPLAVLALLLFVPINKRWRKNWQSRIMMLIGALALAVSVTGCGAGFAMQPAAQSYTLTITGTAPSTVNESTTITHTTTVQLTVQ